MRRRGEWKGNFSRMRGSGLQALPENKVSPAPHPTTSVTGDLAHPQKWALGLGRQEGCFSPPMEQGQLNTRSEPARMPRLIVTPWPHQHSNPPLFFKAKNIFIKAFWDGFLFLQEWVCLLSFFLFKKLFFFSFFLS